MPVPKAEHMVNPTLQIMRLLGGSADVKQINTRLAEFLDLTEADLAETKTQNRPETKFVIRAGNARSILRSLGLAQNDGWQWKLTQAGWVIESLNVDLARKQIEDRGYWIETVPRTSDKGETSLVDDSSEEAWATELRQLLPSLSPRAFERLAVRLLEQLGCVDLTLTRYSKDGGVDVIGFFLEHGRFRTPMIAQAKRHRNPLSVVEVRALRGTASNKAKYAFLITTARFTEDAHHAADEFSNLTMCLIDGDKLVKLLKRHNLGVQTLVRQFEQVIIDIDWFDQLEI